MSIKLLLENRISSIAADSTAANYSVQSLLDDHPAKFWRADGVDTATLTIMTSGSFDTIFLGNTNAEQAHVTITDPNEINLDFTPADSEYFSSVPDVAAELFQNGTSRSLWTDFAKIDTATQIDITLSAATGSVVECGVVRVGEALLLPNMLRGIKHGRDDKSIEIELSSGSFHYESRSRPRWFQFSVMPPRKNPAGSDVYTIMDEIAGMHGKKNFAWNLSDELAGTDWVIFGRLEKMPEAAHNDTDRANTQIRIKEAV